MLKKVFSGILLLLCIVVSGTANAGAQEELSLLDLKNDDVLKKTGVWEHNILDPNQSLRMEMVEGETNTLKLVFDVNSPNPAMGGFWINLEEKDLAGYEWLNLRMKAESDPNFSGNIAIQFADQDGHRAPYLLKVVGDDWKLFQISLNKFRRIRDWSRVDEFEIIINDIHARPKEGALFIREVFVSKGGKAI